MSIGKRIGEPLVDAVRKGAKDMGDAASGSLRKSARKADANRTTLQSTDTASASLTRRQAARMSDEDWGRAAGEMSPSDLAKLLRGTTPDQSMRDAVQGPAGPDGLQVDPLYPDVGDLRRERLEADHIIPLREIVEMEGFRDLTWDQMVGVVNLPDNFIGLSDRVNASKGASSPFTWNGHSEFGPLSPDARELLNNQATSALTALDDKIAGYLS